MTSPYITEQRIIVETWNQVGKTRKQTEKINDDVNIVSTNICTFFFQWNATFCLVWAKLRSGHQAVKKRLKFL